ncbi:5'/3'-nucleotidase SurE [Yinghuangia aomiensis]
MFGVCKAPPRAARRRRARPRRTPVRLAVRGGLAAKVGWKNGLDLVVTGANSGPNVASVTNDSGTLGAAIAGIDNGVPAIALSAGMDMDTFKVTERTYRAFADFVPGFVAGLKQKDLLTDKFVVSVNYPNAVEGRNPGRPVWAEIGTETVVPVAYVPTGDTFAIGMGDCAAPGTFCRPEEKRNADWTLLNQGHITVGAVDSNRTYGGGDDHKLEKFVKNGK